jgi:hypothetical protein
MWPGGLGLEWVAAAWCSAAAAGKFQIAAVSVNAAHTHFVVSVMACILSESWPPQLASAWTPVRRGGSAKIVRMKFACRLAAAPATIC